MANFYSGSANDLSALRSALFSACTSEGWTLSGNILSKGTLFMQVLIADPFLTFQGATGVSNGALTGAAPGVTRLGTILGQSLSWPATYQIFIFDAEVYLIVNYNVGYYQHAAWGKSTVAGLPGTGMWFGSSVPPAAMNSMTVTADGSTSSFVYPCPALFWAGVNSYYGPDYRTYWVHHDLDSLGWWPTPAANSYGSVIGVDSLTPLMSLLPNAWNSEAVLLPARSYTLRGSAKASLVADLQHARFTRIDNHEPGEVITIGSDKWKVFPWYLKNSAVRNGGTPVTHSGTFGWAIRYVP